MRPIHLAALRRRHLDQHFRCGDAQRMALFARPFQAERCGVVFDVAVVGEDVQTTARAMRLVNRAHQRQDVWDGGTIARLVNSHEKSLAP